MSVVEVVVAGAMSAVVMAAVVAVFSGSLRAVRNVSVRTSSSADTRIAMEEVTRELRVATKPDGMASAVILGTPSTLSFYALLDRSGSTVAANTDQAPSRIDYTTVAGCFTVATTPMVIVAGAWVPDSAHVVSKCLLRTTVPAAFSYYASGVISVAGVDTVALPAQPGLASADLPLVQSVEVTLTSQSATTTDLPASQLRSRVTLTNVLIQSGS